MKKYIFLIPILVLFIGIIATENIQCSNDLFEMKDIGLISRGMSKTDLNSNLGIFGAGYEFLLEARTFEMPDSISGPDKKIEVVLAKADEGLFFSWFLFAFDDGNLFFWGYPSEFNREDNPLLNKIGEEMVRKILSPEFKAAKEDIAKESKNTRKQIGTYWVLMNDVGYFHTNKKLFGSNNQGVTLHALKIGKYISQHSFIYASYTSYAASFDIKDYEISYGNLGYQYRFSRNKFTPYVGVELHAGHISWNGENILFGLDPVGGIKFEIATKFDMRLEIKQHLTFANSGVPSYLNFNIGLDYNNL